MGDLVMETFRVTLTRLLDFNQTTTWMLLQMYFVDAVNADGHLTIRKADQPHSGWARIPPALRAFRAKTAFSEKKFSLRTKASTPT